MTDTATHKGHLIRHLTIGHTGLPGCDFDEIGSWLAEHTDPATRQVFIDLLQENCPEDIAGQTWADRFFNLCNQNSLGFILFEGLFDTDLNTFLSEPGQRLQLAQMAVACDSFWEMTSKKPGTGLRTLSLMENALHPLNWDPDNFSLASGEPFSEHVPYHVIIGGLSKTRITLQKQNAVGPHRYQPAPAVLKTTYDAWQEELAQPNNGVHPGQANQPHPQP